MRSLLSGKRVLAIVPHQDDEVIGMGGQLAMAALEARSVHVVLVTDGAADGGVKSLCGSWHCSRLREVVDSPELGGHNHDARLIQGDNDAVFHAWPSPLPFPIHDDPDRAPGFESPTWGKFRDADFLEVLRVLGIPRDHTHFAYWDPDCPEHIKDGQIAIGGAPLSPEWMVERYQRVASHYFQSLQPEIVLTMAPYEYLAPPNDHWAMALGVQNAAALCGIDKVIYNHSGLLYNHLVDGGTTDVESLTLSDAIWEIKRRALKEYLVWNPSAGQFATAAHSVPRTLKALFSGLGQTEYISREPILLHHKETP